MKKGITISQWDELTHEQKDKLDAFHTPNTWEMTIADMIEFLEEYWYTYILEANSVEGFAGIDLKYKGELADALWSACKEKLHEDSFKVDKLPTIISTGKSDIGGIGEWEVVKEKI